MSHQLKEPQIHSKKWEHGCSPVGGRPPTEPPTDQVAAEAPDQTLSGGNSENWRRAVNFLFSPFQLYLFLLYTFFTLSSSPSSPTKKNYQRVNSENWKCTGQFFCVSLHWPTDFWNHLQSFHSINPECSVMFGSGGYLVFCPFSADLKTAKHCTRYDGMDDIGRGAGILLGMYETNMA